MTRKRFIQISVLNIAMHTPHSPQQYVDLLNETFKRAETIKIGLLHIGMIGVLYPEDRENMLRGLIGEIYRFVKLDTTEPWFNLETLEAATEDEVNKIRIPEHLLPHLSRIPFYFLPEQHELWFVKQDRKTNLSPAMAAKLLYGLFRPMVIEKRFPEIEVTPIPDSSILEKMLSNKSLEKIYIELNRPNTDGGGSEEAKWQSKLENQSAKCLKMELVAASETAIRPDEETRGLAKAAAKNGKVRIEARDADGLRVSQSTEEHPYVERAFVNPEIETVQDVLKRQALMRLADILMRGFT